MRNLADFKKRLTVGIELSTQLESNPISCHSNTFEGSDIEMKVKNVLTLKDISVKRVNNDSNGNPRLVIHFLNLITEQDANLSITNKYNLALSRAKKYGGRKFHNKQYGGGIAFQEYNDTDVLDIVNKILAQCTI